MPSRSYAPNYITKNGLARLRDELKRLLLSRPPPAPLGTVEDRALHTGLGARIAKLDRRIAAALVAGEQHAPDCVGFGAEVLLLDDAGNTLQVAIVGEDEANPARGKLAHLSDTAQALIGRRAGEVVFLRMPCFHAAGTARADGSGELSYAYRRYVIASFDYCAQA